MKAILVIDVDDINRFHADVYKEDEKCNGELVMSYLPFKPIPKYYPSTSNPQRIEYLKQLGMTEKEQYYYELGHDDCIDEKLGED